MRRLYIAATIVLGATTATAACSSAPGPLPQECPIYNTNDTTGSGETSGAGETTATTDGSGGATGATTGVGGQQAGVGGGVQLPSGAEIRSRQHGCRKLRYETLGTVLGNLGVNVTTIHNDLSLDAVIAQCLQQQNMPDACTTPKQLVRCQNDSSTLLQFPGPLTDICAADEVCFCPQTPCANDPSGDPEPGNEGKAGFCVKQEALLDGDVIEQLHPSAAFLYQTGKDSLSVPKTDSRTLEKDGHTTSSAMRIMDVFIQAAPEIIANIGTPSKTPACTVDGENPHMFDPDDGSCVEEAVSCLIGYPATDDHMLLCNLILDKADTSDAIDVQKKQFIAVATLLSAAHTCE